MKPNICILLFAGIVAFLISGCHSTHAVVRGATVSKTPTFGCISNAVMRVPGVTQIMPVNVTPEPSWTVYHRQSRQLPYENFLYLGPQNMRGMITIKPQWKGATVFQMSRIWTDRTPSNAEVDQTRLLMDEIYSALSLECGGFPPPENVSEQFLDLQSYNRSLATDGNAKNVSP